MLETVALVFRIILGLLFIVTSILKLPDLKGFYVVLVSYNLFPSWFARLTAYTLPLAELISGVWLLTGIKQKYSALIVLLLLIASTLIVLTALLKRKLLPNCGCYGTAFAVPISWAKFFENIVWVVMAVVVLYASFH